MTEEHIVAGQLFTYEHGRRFLRRQLGAGQVLGREDLHEIVFVRIFDVSSSELRPIIGFLPVAVDAFRRSRITAVKHALLPDDWETHRDEWRVKWRAGEAGVFADPLGKILQLVSRTVSDIDAESVIELAFPKQQAGRFDSIAAYVRKASE